MDDQHDSTCHFGNITCQTYYVVVSCFIGPFGPTSPNKTHQESIPFPSHATSCLMSKKLASGLQPTSSVLTDYSVRSIQRRSMLHGQNMSPARMSHFPINPIMVDFWPTASLLADRGDHLALTPVPSCVMQPGSRQKFQRPPQHVHGCVPLTSACPVSNHHFSMPGPAPRPNGQFARFHHRELRGQRPMCQRFSCLSC